ncbi:DNA-directed RNA polymerase sigma-70 factor [Streptomyces spiroverticillatus]|uniref:DNA-directed RNA polymerase sigma-70 factor n=1 Tax=Streptomyces finlayi TaxID=67296 RepID=A0A918X1B8_9ACTN|nr:sigma-70 family RNA polymerase sigma factor [Streptomyces finlayi]GHA19369.1 DNA-directed RNA polymerase sigma-70 factor [Streptomyces spiroverticillatus]GHD02358.1 DNA-directed RNA polymerase sigma-70 factor [Streptomyces finlayi]
MVIPIDDEQSYTDSYRLHFAAVESYIRRRVNADAAPDVVAEVFTVAWRRWHEAPRERLLPWLYGVARLTLANAYRDERRRAQLAGSLAEVTAEHVADHAADVTERLAVAAAFDGMNPADQEVLRLDIWEGLPPRDAAVVLGCTTAAFHVRLHRARRRFRQAVTTATEPFPAQQEVLAAEWGAR